MGFQITDSITLSSGLSASNINFTIRGTYNIIKTSENNYRIEYLLTRFLNSISTPIDNIRKSITLNNITNVNIYDEIYNTEKALWTGRTIIDN